MDANQGIECVRMKDNGLYDVGDADCYFPMGYICQHL